MFNNEFPPLGGGTGTVNLELFNIFKKNHNLQIDLVTSSFQKKKEIEQFSENIQIIKLPVRKKDIHHASNLELIIYAFKATVLARKLHKQNNYDLIFVWSTVPAGLPAIFLKKFKNIPYVVRVGGSDIPGFEQRYSVVYKIITPFIKKVWINAKIIIAKCKTEKKMISAINPNLKISIINNGIDTDVFFPKDKEPKEQLKIICSARLIKRKGQETLINAISILKEKGIFPIIDFVGDGDAKEEYIQLAKFKGVFEQTKFLSYVPRKNMPKLYQNADIFILPSFNEGMSNALLEAMSCGLPVVVTNVGGTEELVNNSNGYVFTAGNINELVKILEELHFNKKSLKKLGQNSRKKAELFNWNNIANEYLNLFNNIVK